MARIIRLGAISPRRTRSSRPTDSAATTASGTIASGTTNTSGTNASCVGTVKPNGVSNSTLVASASTSTHRTVWTNGKPCGGLVAHSAAAAAANAAVVVAVASRSRVDMARRRVCKRAASSDCSSIVGSIDILRDIGSVRRVC